MHGEELLLTWRLGLLVLEELFSLQQFQRPLFPGVLFRNVLILAKYTVHCLGIKAKCIRK